MLVGGYKTTHARNDMNAKESLGWTPFVNTCTKGHKGAVFYLLLEWKRFSQLHENLFGPIENVRIF